MRRSAGLFPQRTQISPLVMVSSIELENCSVEPNMAADACISVPYE